MFILDRQGCFHADPNVAYPNAWDPNVGPTPTYGKSLKKPYIVGIYGLWSLGWLFRQPFKFKTYIGNWQFCEHDLFGHGWVDLLGDENVTGWITSPTGFKMPKACSRRGTTVETCWNPRLLAFKPTSLGSFSIYWSLGKASQNQKRTTTPYIASKMVKYLPLAISGWCTVWTIWQVLLLTTQGKIPNN